MEINASLVREWLVSCVSNWTSLNVRSNLDLFFDLGLDSLHYAELISGLETELGFQLDFTSLADWESVRTIDGLTEFVVSSFQG